MRSDRRLTLRMISSNLNLNRFTVHQILTQDLDMRKVCAKIVPKNFTTEQKANRRDVCLDLLDALRGSQNSSVALSQVMNHGFWSTTPETKRQSREWHTANPSRPKKARMSKSKIKSMLICFFDSPEGICAIRTNCQSSFFIGKSLKDSGKGWHVCDQALHALGCCTTTCHTAVSINEFLAEKSIPVVPQPPYSPNLSPCDFLLFPRLKNHFKGRHFGTSDNMQKNVTNELRGIPAEAFHHCCEQWKQHLRRCVVAQGNCFEGDNLNL